MLLELRKAQLCGVPPTEWVSGYIKLPCQSKASHLNFVCHEVRKLRLLCSLSYILSFSRLSAAVFRTSWTSFVNFHMMFTVVSWVTGTKHQRNNMKEQNWKNQKQKLTKAKAADQDCVDLWLWPDVSHFDSKEIWSLQVMNTDLFNYFFVGQWYGFQVCRPENCGNFNPCSVSRMKTAELVEVWSNRS